LALSVAGLDGSRALNGCLALNGWLALNGYLALNGWLATNASLTGVSWQQFIGRLVIASKLTIAAP
jgi:hypothetical protein